MLLVIYMAKIKVRLYGLIPAKFVVKDIDMYKPFNLKKLEKEIISKYGDVIHKDYISDRGLLNHQLVRIGDSSGRRLDYEDDISGIEEIWFIVPISGG